MKENNNIPEEVIDYCIDNKVPIEKGMIAYLDKKFESVEKEVALFKEEVIETMDKVNAKIDADEMREVEDYLNFLDSQGIQG